MHPVAKRIASLMLEKQSRLTLSADVDKMSDLLCLANDLGPYIVVLKTHIDCIEDFSFPLIKELQKLAEHHRFLIFEDRKFADIGHTAQKQFRGGIYHIAEWADLINAHGISGSTQIDALKSCVDPSKTGLLLIANMSQEKNLFSADYSKRVIELGQQHENFVCGFIAPNLKVPKEFLNFSPGIHLEKNRDEQGQCYKHPDELREFNIDSIIVGRGILQSPDPVKAAQLYAKLSIQNC